jgi:hypothetical protein
MSTFFGDFCLFVAKNIAESSNILSQNAIFFSIAFGENISKIITLIPGLRKLSQFCGCWIHE